MKIAGYEIHPIETGTFALDGGAMFGVVPKTLWEKTNAPDEKNRIALASRALLLIGNGRTILIDVGNGSKYSEKITAIYKIDARRHDLVSSLKTYSISPEDITDVILTHLHFDHAGGSTFKENGEAKPTFPNAKYHVQYEHWQAALHPTERDRASFFPDDYMPLQQHGRLEFTEGETEVIPDIRVRVIHGHTAALQCPVISDGTTTLFFCADLVPTTSHVQLPWIMAYDLRPLVTLEEKRTILSMAADEHWTLFFEHDPLTVAAKIRKGEKGFVLDGAVEL